MDFNYYNKYLFDLEKYFHGQDDGDQNSEDEELFVENPSDLIGKPMYYKVQIKSIYFNELKWKDVFV